jgi:CheY-like chemotaxis protein
MHGEPHEHAGALPDTLDGWRSLVDRLPQCVGNYSAVRDRGGRSVDFCVEYDLHGRLDRSFERDGSACRIEFPLGDARSSSSAASPPPCEPRETSTPVRRIMMLVEDNALLANSMRDLLEGLGVEVLGPARTHEDAMRLIDREAATSAMLDVDLGGEKSYPLARRLRELGVPFILLTSYEAKDIPEDLRDARMLSTPIEREQIESFIDELG